MASVHMSTVLRVAIWASIVLPYSMIRWTHARPWNRPSVPFIVAWIGMDIAIAISGVGIISQFPEMTARGWCVMGAAVGGGLAAVALFGAGVFSVRFSFFETVEFAGWSTVGGSVCGALRRYQSRKCESPDIARKYFICAAGVTWIVILRIAQLAVAAHLLDPALTLGEELFSFIPVLAWSRLGASLLFKNGSRRFWPLLAWSVFTGFITLRVSAMSIGVISLVTWGHGGTYEAITLLGNLPGPGTVWGITVTWILGTLRPAN